MSDSIRLRPVPRMPARQLRRTPSGGNCLSFGLVDPREEVPPCVQGPLGSGADAVLVDALGRCQLAEHLALFARMLDVELAMNLEEGQGRAVGDAVVLREPVDLGRRDV